MALVLHSLCRFCGQRMADRIAVAQWLDYPAHERFEKEASTAIFDRGTEIYVAAMGSAERGILFAQQLFTVSYVSRPELAMLDPMCRH